MENNTRRNLLRKIVTGVSLAPVMLVLWAQAAYAGPFDGVTTQVNTAKTDIETFVTTTGVVVVFGLALLGVAIRIGMRILRRGTAAV